MILKKAAGTAVAAAMLAGLGTVATATTASANANCYQTIYYNSDLAPKGYWIPDHNLSYAPNYQDGCVVILQQELNQELGAGLATDGYFGQNTLYWVNKFQSALNCAGGIDGVAGPNTMSCLAWATSQTPA
ncbi:hypothetical protein DN069_17545 [Streptacidiphilus pinicola]|uniref:Peptidoglycan binding-like domain-containing protein n=1 Tax=Streptacidiphilus pinicola TaxID=2219663 RepID=A0A2X0K4U6_9ACTN|nr:peptidoglycan-binding protein [Streptacidiphilus pinicola]RAG84295.1 hypothetical protein DN069_17545 [Streptacidiphilus pinicola]